MSYYREVYFDPQDDITASELASILQFIFIECALGQEALFPIKIQNKGLWARYRLLLQEKYPEAVRHFRGVTPREGKE